jgi:site-specific recombinase XerD
MLSVSKLLGHASIAATQIYVAVPTDGLRAAVLGYTWTASTD